MRDKICLHVTETEASSRAGERKQADDRLLRLLQCFCIVDYIKSEVKDNFLLSMREKIELKKELLWQSLTKE